MKLTFFKKLVLTLLFIFAIISGCSTQTEAEKITILNLQAQEGLNNNNNIIDSITAYNELLQITKNTSNEDLTKLRFKIVNKLLINGQVNEAIELYENIQLTEELTKEKNELLIILNLENKAKLFESQNNKIEAYKNYSDLVIELFRRDRLVDWDYFQNKTKSLQPTSRELILKLIKEKDYKGARHEMGMTATNDEELTIIRFLDSLENIQEKT